MNKVLLILFFSILSINARELVEHTVRGGIPNFVAKLEAGKKVKIVYLGGSITSQPGYRVLSGKWFQKKYPKSQVEEISAAIGGTGAELGTFRLGHDALRHKLTFSLLNLL